MSRKELVQEIISVAAPIFIKKALKYLSLGNVPTEDELSREVFAECEEVNVDDGIRTLPIGSDVKYAGPYGNLVSTLCMVVDDLANDIKAQITQELLMKLHIELEHIRSEVTDHAKSRGNSGNDLAAISPYGGVFNFDVTSNDTHLDTINVGYSSIKNYVPGGGVTNNPIYDIVAKKFDHFETDPFANDKEEFKNIGEGVSTNSDFWDTMLKEKILSFTALHENV